jgi:hypothetical protein
MHRASRHACPPTLTAPPPHKVPVAPPLPHLQAAQHALHTWLPVWQVTIVVSAPNPINSSVTAPAAPKGVLLAVQIDSDGQASDLSGSTAATPTEPDSVTVSVRILPRVSGTQQASDTVFPPCPRAHACTYAPSLEPLASYVTRLESEGAMMQAMEELAVQPRSVLSSALGINVAGVTVQVPAAP